MPTLRVQLTRIPNVRLAKRIIREELDDGFENELEPAAIKRFAKEVADWAQLPNFYTSFKMRGSAHVYEWHLHVDKTEEGGLHFWWVNFGTGLEGPEGQTYVIEPVHAPVLNFVVPYQPKTIPPGGLLYNPSDPPHWISTYHIDHPGMRPRYISERIFDEFAQKGHRHGFYQVIDRAFKRAFARLSHRP